MGEGRRRKGKWRKRKVEKEQTESVFGVLFVCLFLRKEKVLAMGIKRLYYEGSEITKGKNTWENRGTGWVEQGERSKTEIKRSADLVRSCGRCPIDGTKKVVI